MADDTPKTKEEMEEALEDLQIDPADLDSVAGGVGATCETCYSKYSSV